MFEKPVRGISYINNPGLSPTQKDALSHYHDVEHVKDFTDWDYPVTEKPPGIRMDCYMVNNYLRDSLRLRNKDGTMQLSRTDKAHLAYLIPNIDSSHKHIRHQNTPNID